MKSWLLLAALAWGTAYPGVVVAQDDWDPKAVRDARETAREFVEADPDLETFFREAAGFAVFPTVGKGGLIVGGAHGDGIVFERGVPIGTTSLIQATIGLQIGGQSYSEIIFFEDDESLTRYKESKLELSAQASAVAVKEGISTDVAYESGVAVITRAKGGLMAEASVGGQSFKYKPRYKEEEPKEEE